MKYKASYGEGFSYTFEAENLEVAKKILKDLGLDDVYEIWVEEATDPGYYSLIWSIDI